MCGGDRGLQMVFSYSVTPLFYSIIESFLTARQTCLTQNSRSRTVDLAQQICHALLRTPGTEQSICPNKSAMPYSELQERNSQFVPTNLCKYSSNSSLSKGALMMVANIQLMIWVWRPHSRAVALTDFDPRLLMLCAWSVCHEASGKLFTLYVVTSQTDEYQTYILTRTNSFSSLLMQEWTLQMCVYICGRNSSRD